MGIEGVPRQSAQENTSERERVQSDEAREHSEVERAQALIRSRDETLPLGVQLEAIDQVTDSRQHALLLEELHGRLNGMSLANERRRARERLMALPPNERIAALQELARAEIRHGFLDFEETMAAIDDPGARIDLLIEAAQEFRRQDLGFWSASSFVDEGEALLEGIHDPRTLDKMLSKLADLALYADTRRALRLLERIAELDVKAETALRLAEEADKKWETFSNNPYLAPAIEATNNITDPARRRQLLDRIESIVPRSGA